MTWHDLRSKYPTFIYKSYHIHPSPQGLHCSFTFIIDGLSSFSPVWQLPINTNLSIEDPLLHQLVFSLGMVEAISYWKIACPPMMIVAAGHLSNLQQQWWKKLYFHGLGEFFYCNQIDTTLDNFLTLQCTHPKETLKAPNYGSSDIDCFQGALIPIGGGKDSAVTVQLLSSLAHENNCFIIGDRPSAKYTAHIGGFSSSQIICAHRTLDAKMLQLNQQGFLNGHTPFSAIVAFSSVLVAYLTQKKYVVLSNESSANESTIGSINHQYSKSYEFEKDFNDYLAHDLCCPIHYFSFLRPLSEFQIAKLFSTFTPYHAIFRSCNRGAKQDVWCGHCAKCLFVAIILSPFLTEDALSNIFPHHQNPLHNPALQGALEQLTGIQPHKPFECVGSRDEVNFSICQAIHRLQQRHSSLPFLYQYYCQTTLYHDYKHRQNPYSTYYNTHHLLPLAFEQLLKEGWKACSNP